MTRTPEESFDGLILEADWADMHGGGHHDDNCEVCRDIANVRTALETAAVSQPAVQSGDAEATPVEDLPLYWQGWSNAIRLMEERRGEPDMASLRQADAYEKCAKELRAALAAHGVAQGALNPLDGGRPLPIDRETLGRLVREAWVKWAETQHNPKPTWLVPYNELEERDKEADRQIGESIARWTLVFDACALSSASRGTEA